MVIARWQRVRVAFSGSQTSRHPVTPSGRWETAITTVTARRTARVHLLRRQADIVVVGNAFAIRHSFGRRERPARAARRLITNVTNAGTLWPVRTRIKRRWKRVKRSRPSTGFGWKTQFLRRFQNAHQTFRLFKRHVFKETSLVGGGGPRVTFRIVTSNFFSENCWTSQRQWLLLLLLLWRDGQSRGSEKQNKH